MLYNVTLIMEGEEENGSIGLEEFCKRYISDTVFSAVVLNDSHWKNEAPVIYCGTRGQISIIIEYEVEGMVENLHAGNYGGIERGAARTFLQILIKLLDEIDKIIGINPTTESEYANAVSLTYINSGDEKRSTIPNCAIAKLDVRYVDEGVLSKINDVLKKKASENKITYSIEQCEAGYYNEPDYKFVEKLIEIIDSVTLKKTSIKKYCGAYLPINKMESIQGTKYIIPFAQEDENNHSPNENISLEHIKYGMKIVKEILICSKNE